MNETGQKPSRDLRDAILVYLAAVLLAVAVVQLKRFIPLVKGNASVIVAAGFLVLTVLAVWRRKEELRDYGFGPDHWKGEILFVLLLCAVIFPPYIVGFKIYWHPPSPFHFRLTMPLWTLALNHLVVVALPEELLFRGFIQQRLGAVLKKRIRIAGMTLGWHIPAAAALFALGHLASNPHPNRLATFFPALVFGVIRERRGSLIGCIRFHAACNIFSDIVVWGYFPHAR
jgi:membrane protease YdiL (CAAX protease family)